MALHRTALGVDGQVARRHGTRRTRPAATGSSPRRSGRTLPSKWPSGPEALGPKEGMVT